MGRGSRPRQPTTTEPPDAAPCADGPSTIRRDGCREVPTRTRGDRGGREARPRRQLRQTRATWHVDARRHRRRLLLFWIPFRRTATRRGPHGRPDAGDRGRAQGRAWPVLAPVGLGRRVEVHERADRVAADGQDVVHLGYLSPTSTYVGLSGRPQGDLVRLRLDREGAQAGTVDVRARRGRRTGTTTRTTAAWSAPPTARPTSSWAPALRAARGSSPRRSRPAERLVLVGAVTPRAASSRARASSSQVWHTFASSSPAPTARATPRAWCRRPRTARDRRAGVARLPLNDGFPAACVMGRSLRVRV